MAENVPLHDSIISKSECLIKALEESGADAWLSHIPLPRVIEILVQSLSSSITSCPFKDDGKLLLPLCIAAGHCPSAITEFISKIPSDSTAWETLAKNSQRLSKEILVLVFNRRLHILERKVLQCLEELGSEFISDSTKLPGLDDADSVQQFLGHCCSSTSEKSKDIPSIFSGHLPSAVASDKKLFEFVYDTLSRFLLKCKFSLLSIKVVHLFFAPIMDMTETRFLPSSLFTFWDLLSFPPCARCNPLVSSNSDLEIITKKIDDYLHTIATTEIIVIITLFCIKCEWLVYYRKFSSLRILFLNL